LKKIYCCLILLFCVLSIAAQCPVSPSAEGPVSYYGELKVKSGTPNIDGVKESREKNIEQVQIRGVSFFWSDWSLSFYNANAVERLAKDWKAEVVRAAFGPYRNSTVAIKTVVDAAIANDIYVIIDWHSHSAHNESETSKAITFFTEMAETYGSCDHVIFELYNEPLNIPWADIKSYAEKVIPVIRQHSDNLILVGTPIYSQKVEDVIGYAIDDINVAYVLHFYAASHPLNDWRNNIVNARANNLPLFVTEYGTTHSSGGCSPEVSDCGTDVNGKPISYYNTHNATRSDEWHAFMDGRKISSVAWSVFDKYEGSAFFGTVPNGTFDQTIEENWSDTTKMTTSGKYIFKKLNEYYKCVPYNPDYDEESCKPAVSPVLPFVKDLQFNNAIAEVYTLQGKKMGNLHELNLKNGIYIVRLRQNGAVQTKIMRIAK